MVGRDGADWRRKVKEGVYDGDAKGTISTTRYAGHLEQESQLKASGWHPQGRGSREVTQSGA